MEKHNHLTIYIVICLCGLFLCTCNSSDEKAEFIFPKDILKEGDIVFRCGNSMVSRVVLAADKMGMYSHIGIVVKSGNEWKIVHAVPGEPDFEGDTDRVKEDSIQKFFSPQLALSGAVLRINNDSLAQKAAAKAIEILKRNVLFDHDYDLDDTTKMYCTEFIHFIYNGLGIDLTEGRRSNINAPSMSGTYIFPSDIQLNKDLQIIYDY